MIVGIHHVALHETNGLAPSSQVISFTFFLILILHVLQFSLQLSPIQLVKQRLSGPNSSASSCWPLLQLDVANKAHNKRVSPVITGCIWLYLCFRLPILLGTQPCFQIQRWRSNNSTLARSLSASSCWPLLQLDVANKAHNKRVSPVITGCILIYLCLPSLDFTWGPNLGLQIQRSRSKISLDRSLSALSCWPLLQLDLANKAHIKRVSPLITGCIS